MDIKQLSYFVMIVEEGTISAAAKKLHISQPPLSQQLKSLEQELGMILLERGARRVTLTDAGKILYQYALNILSLAHSAKKELSDFKDDVQGTLRLGTVSSSGSGLLDWRMKEFHRCFPKISFEIHEGNTFELLELLTANVIEVAVVRTPFQADDVKCIYLEEEPMVAVGSLEFLTEIQTDTILLSQLSDKPLIIYRRFEGLLDSSFQVKGLTPNVFCKNDDARTALLWANAGLGVAIMPQSAVRMIPNENMICKAIEEPSLYTQLVVVYKNNAYVSATAKSFLNMQQNGGTLVKQ